MKKNVGNKTSGTRSTIASTITISLFRRSSRLLTLNNL